MSHQNDEAWKIGLEFELLCMLDFRRVTMDIEKNRQNNDAYKSEYSNWNQSYRIWIRIETSAVFMNFVAHSERKPDQPEGAQIMSWNKECFLYFKKYRSNVELSLSTFWSWFLFSSSSKSSMKPVLLTPGLSIGKTAHYKWRHTWNVI